MRTKLAIGAGALAVFAFAATAIALQQDNAAEPATEQASSVVAPASANDDGVETIDGPAGDTAVDAGTTAMPAREAVVGLLNKRNGIARDLALKPGQSTRIGDAVVHLRACEKTAPWETEQLTGAFVQLDVRGADTRWRRVFSGWLYKERPSYNVVLHPIYDVWPKSCTMSFPASGPETIAAGGAEPSTRSGARRSRASNAGALPGAAAGAAATPSIRPAEDSAPSSNAT